MFFSFSLIFFWFEQSEPRALSTAELQQAAKLTDATLFRQHLNPLLTKRLVGTPEHAAARKVRTRRRVWLKLATILIFPPSCSTSSTRWKVWAAGLWSWTSSAKRHLWAKRRSSILVSVLSTTGYPFNFILFVVCYQWPRFGQTLTAGWCCPLTMTRSFTKMTRR